METRDVSLLVMPKDNPALVNTGYGKMGRYIGPLLQKAGFDLRFHTRVGHSQNIMHFEDPTYGEEIEIWTGGDGPYGEQIVPGHMERLQAETEKPPLLFFIGDVEALNEVPARLDKGQFMGCAWAASDWEHPTQDGILNKYEAFDTVFPMSHHAHQVHEQDGLDNLLEPAWLGVNTSIFHPTDENLEQTRESMGFTEDGFNVVSMFANQYQRKGEQEMFESLALFQSRHPDVDLNFFALTQARRDWNLPQLIDHLDMDDIVTLSRPYNYVMGDVLETDVARMYNCFTGETEFFDQGSLRRMEDCVGSKVHVYDHKGELQPAEVKSFGRQEVQEVVLKPNGYRTNLELTYRCTPDHRWILEGGSVTTQLEEGDKIEVAPIDETSSDSTKDEVYYSEGFVHGFVFGDGTRRSNHEDRFFLRLCAPKDREFQDILESVPCHVGTYYPPSSGGDPTIEYKSDVDYKSLPDTEDLPLSYMRGFIEGWLRADGTVNTSGNWVLAHNDRENIEWLKDNATLGGYVPTGISHHRGSGYNPDAECYKLTLSDEPVTFRVQEIKNQEEEEVYCVVQPNTESFVLRCGVPTGNCADVALQIGYEGFGLGTVEAQACGTPVIGLASAATPELHKSGILVPPRKEVMRPNLIRRQLPDERFVLAALEITYERVHGQALADPFYREHPEVRAAMEQRDEALEEGPRVMEHEHVGAGFPSAVDWVRDNVTWEHAAERVIHRLDQTIQHLNGQERFGPPGPGERAQDMMNDLVTAERETSVQFQD